MHNIIRDILLKKSPHREVGGALLCRYSPHSSPPPPIPLPPPIPPPLLLSPLPPNLCLTKYGAPSHPLFLIPFLPFSSSPPAIEFALA